jgi:hypothetical protein
VTAVKATVAVCIPAVVGLPGNHEAEPTNAGWLVIIGIGMRVPIRSTSAGGVDPATGLAAGGGAADTTGRSG